MTNTKGQVLETNVVLFTSALNKETAANDSKNEVVTIEKTTLKTDIKIRFSRLKKSMRKRSVSIL